MSLNTGLISYYTMNNISGSTLIDETGNYDLTINGSTGVDADGYLIFSGSNYCQGSTNRTYTNKLAVSFEINLSNTSSNMPIISKRFTTSGANDYQFEVRQDGTDVRALLWGTSNVDNTVSSNINALQDYTIQFIYNGATFDIYINNSLISSTSLTGNIDDNIANIRIGNDWFSNNLEGVLKNVRTYYRNVSLAEVDALNNPNIGGISPNTTQRLPPSSGTGSIDVATIEDTDSWTASSDQSWLTITSGSSGTGDGTISFDYDEFDELLGEVRTAVVTVTFPGGDRTVSFTQTESGLVVYYTMQNISGNTLIDETGIYDATIYGATPVVDGLSFDGVDDYTEALGFTETVRAVVIELDLVNKVTAASPRQTLFDFNDTGNFYQRSIELGESTSLAIDETLSVNYSLGGATEEFRRTFIRNDIDTCYTTLIINYDEVTGKYKIYRNGIELTEYAGTYGDSLLFDSFIDRIVIGRSLVLGGYLNAVVKNVKIYNESLSSSVIDSYIIADEILEVSPTGTISVGSSSSTGNIISVFCSNTYTATSDQPWLTIDSITQGCGGEVEYSYTENTSYTSSRTATITIQGEDNVELLVINQEPKPAPITIDPSGSITTSNTAQSDTITVTASNQSNTWTAVSNVSWIIIDSGSSGTGDGTVEYSIKANDFNERVGQITVTSDGYSVILEITQEEIVTVINYTYTQYNNAPTLNILIKQFYDSNSLDQYALEYYNNVFNLDTAVGNGLDFWGIVLNQSRVVKSFATNNIFGFGTPDLGTADEYPQNFDSGNFGMLETNTTNTTLDDDDYRRILKIRYRSLTTNNSIATISDIINEYTQSIDPSYFCLVKNESIGTFSYNFNYFLSSSEIGMFLISRFLPSPAGMDYVVNWGVTL